MKTHGQMCNDSSKPWGMWNAHRSKRPIVLCKATYFGFGGLNCTCCNHIPKLFKRMTNRAIRRSGKQEIFSEV